MHEKLNKNQALSPNFHLKESRFYRKGIDFFIHKVVNKVECGTHFASRELVQTGIIFS